MTLPAPPPAEPLRRSPVIATLLSLACPGLGQIYAVRYVRGLGFLIAICWLIALDLYFSLAGPPLLGEILSGLALAAGLASAADAAWVAARPRAAVLGPLNRIWIYGAISMLPLVLVVFVSPSILLKSYTIPSASMEPTIDQGDLILTSRGYFTTHAPARGDLVIVLVNGTRYAKRVIGLPGDHIEIEDDVVRINGEEAQQLASTAPEDEPQIFYECLPEGKCYWIERHRRPLHPGLQTYTVPTGHVFVLGDNRDNAIDSRQTAFGMIPLGDLLDRPVFVLTARDPHRFFTALE